MRFWPIVLLAVLSAGCSGGGSDETPKVEGKVEVVAPPAGAGSREDKMAESRARALQGRTGEEDSTAIGDGR